MWGKQRWWSRVEKLDVEAADWMARGEEDFSWLGYSLHGLSVDNRTLLLVGSPTWRNSNRQAPRVGPGTGGLPRLPWEPVEGWGSDTGAEALPCEEKRRRLWGEVANPPP